MSGALAAADPTLSDFNQQIWWLVLLKVGIVFVFLLLTTIFMIWFERRVIGRMQNRPGPNRAGPFGLLQPIADEMDVHLGLPSAAAARAELAALGAWKGARPAAPEVLSGRGGYGGAEPSHARGGPGGSSPQGDTEHRLATWHQLVDAGRMQDGEPYLAATARPVVARVSPVSAADAGLHDGDKVIVHSALGTVTVPLAVTEKMADGVVWLPTNSPGSAVRADLGAGHGSRVTLRRAE